MNLRDTVAARNGIETSTYLLRADQEFPRFKQAGEKLYFAYRGKVRMDRRRPEAGEEFIRLRAENQPYHSGSRWPVLAVSRLRFEKHGNFPSIEAQLQRLQRHRKLLVRTNVSA